MQMDAPNGKANSNSAIILPDAFIAGRAIQEAYENSSDEFVIGEPIQVNVQMVTALPISEARNENRSEEHTSELQSRFDLVCRLLLEKKNRTTVNAYTAHE